MRRRDFLKLLGSGTVAWRPLSTQAQQSKPSLIALFNFQSAETLTKNYEAFRAGLRQLGYVDGRDIRFEYRHADGHIDRLPGLAEELVKLNPRVIVSASRPTHFALQKATTTIPIVMATGADPVGLGLVQSLSHPGGNITGLATSAEVLAPEQFDVVRELLPRVTRVAVLVNVNNPLHVPQLQEIEAAAAKASITVVRFNFHVPHEFEQAFTEFESAKIHALLVPPDATFATHRERIIKLAARARLPAIYGNRIWVDAGGLLSYGPDPTESYRRSAVFVDKILKGANPADLPVEQPTKIELAINLKTAKALGLTVPPSLLAHADEVIE